MKKLYLNRFSFFHKGRLLKPVFLKKLKLQVYTCSSAPPYPKSTIPTGVAAESREELHPPQQTPSARGKKYLGQLLQDAEFIKQTL